MHYYNGLSAAKRINISYKTLLRYIEKGRIIPEEGKTPTGQLVISEDQVEALRLEVQRERDMLRHSQAAISRHPETAIDRRELPLTDTTLTETIKQLGKLAARVDVQDARIAELERRVVELERQSQTSIDRPSQPQAPLHRFVVDREEATKAPPQNRNAVSPDMLSARDFAAKLGIKYTVFEGMIRHGVRGEQLERIEIPSAREGYSSKYFNSEQQKRALELLRKHGKLS